MEITDALLRQDAPGETTKGKDAYERIAAIIAAIKSDAAFFPSELAGLYTSEGLANRMQYNQAIQRLIEGHLQRTDLTTGEEQYLHHLGHVPRQNVIAPSARFLEEIHAPFDLIAVFFEYVTQRGQAKNVLLVEEYSQQSPVRHGMGKTGLALRLAGVDIPYESIPHPHDRNNPQDAEEAIRGVQSGSLSALPLRRSNTRLIATDLLYLGCTTTGRLVGAPAVGEPFIAQWDIARNICRHHDVYYKEETGETIPWLKEYLLAVASRFYTPFRQEGAFCNPLASRKVTHVLIVSQAEEGKQSLGHGGMAMDTLSRLLRGNPENHPAYPKSQFWKINKQEHARRRDELIASLHVLPHIYTLSIGSRDSLASEPAFQAVHAALNTTP